MYVTAHSNLSLVEALSAPVAHSDVAIAIPISHIRTPYEIPVRHTFGGRSFSLAMLVTILLLSVAASLVR